jgi:transcriptional regulator with XRE-family HTH domain
MEYNAYEIGQRARNIRVNKNIKQGELSETLGIAQSSYSRFENGLYDMPLSEVIKLCDYLGVSVSWLISEKSIPRLTDSERLDVEKYINYVISTRDKRK